MEIWNNLFQVWESQFEGIGFGLIPGIIIGIGSIEIPPVSIQGISIGLISDLIETGSPSSPGVSIPGNSFRLISGKSEQCLFRVMEFQIGGNGCGLIPSIFGTGYVSSPGVSVPGSGCVLIPIMIVN